MKLIYGWRAIHNTFKMYRHSDTKNTFQYNPIHISTVIRLYKTAILKTNKDI